MRLEMQKVPDKDETKIIVYAEQIRILQIADGYVWCEWEGTRWKMSLPTVLAQAILSSDIDDEMRGRFVERLNQLLKEKSE